MAPGAPAPVTCFLLGSSRAKGSCHLLDLYPAAQVAFDPLGHGGEIQSFPMPQAVSFPQHRFTLGSKGGGGMDGRWDSCLKCSAGIALG